jgi:uncharacterized membrane protein
MNLNLLPTLIGLPSATNRGRPGWIMAMGVTFVVVTTAISWFRWTTFRYETFDLAFYVQALWLTLHGKSTTSILGVSLMGNHAEPIVYLLTPVFAIFRHPMLFVVTQNLALGSMAPVGYDIARRSGFGRNGAGLLAAALLLMPATGFVALHEFHPEALAAPLLLLLCRARMRESIGGWWLWFAAVLATKENMCPLLVALCVVQGVVDRRRGLPWVLGWYGFPAAAALGWAFVYVVEISPALNPGAVDYAGLYSHLGANPREILTSLFIHPDRALGAIWQALHEGNLVWGLILPLLAAPLLRPRWLLVAAPVLLQHLLSWRQSEWRTYAHYAAPLIPIFWIAAVEGLARLPLSRHGQFSAALALLLGCSAGQALLGPLKLVAGDLAEAPSILARARDMARLLEQVPSGASVAATIPCLSHLAMRERVYSLHHVLKGLKTLSRAPYPPPAPPEAVFVDYRDTATFDVWSGYYHPQMRTVEGLVVPSSDRLFHDFLSRANWTVIAQNEFTLFLRRDGMQRPTGDAADGEVLRIDEHSLLERVTVEGDRSFNRGAPLRLRFKWRFEGERSVFPWLILRIEGPSGTFEVYRGLCAPEAREGTAIETWQVRPPFSAPAGLYRATAVFVNYPAFLWSRRDGGVANGETVLGAVTLGDVEIRNE